MKTRFYYYDKKISKKKAIELTSIERVNKMIKETKEYLKEEGIPVCDFINGITIELY